jgi:hypothetical protein
MSPALAMMWQQLFGLVQALDPVHVQGGPVWRINDDEAEMLGKATVDYLKTLPKNKKGALQKLIEKHMPLMAFTGALFIVIQPRASASWAAHQQNRANPGWAAQRAAAARAAHEHNQRVHRQAAPGTASAADPDAEVDAAFRDWEHEAVG